MRTLLALCVASFLATPVVAQPPDPGTDAWGGWRGVVTTATGRFRVERIDGVWWLVTPAGHGFFSMGVDHLTPEGDFSPPLGRSPYRDNILARYGSEAAWAAVTLTRLRDLGIDTIGAFSRPDLFPGAIAYTVTLRLSRHAPLVPGVPPPLVPRETRDYFDPAFAAGVATEVPSGAGACAADPWCLGVFTENEIALNQSLAQTMPYLDAYLLLPPGAPGKLALQAFLEDRYAGDLAAFNATWGLALASFDGIQALSALAPAPAFPPGSPTGTAAQIGDRRAFDAYVARRFHQVTHDAIRSAAPEVLILGSRLLVLSTRPEVLLAIAPYVDLLTVNYYELDPAVLAIVPLYPSDYGIPFARLFDDLDTMHRLTGKPLLIGEFGYRAADSGLPNTLPPFFPTLATQRDRAHALGSYLRRVLARPYVVGAHWYQYMDQPAEGRFDGENQNFGLVDIEDDPWPEVTDRLRAVTETAHPRRALAPGGGSPSHDCIVEWTATAPAVAARRATLRSSRARFRCRDGDPACDLDEVAGQCTIELQPCTAVTDGRLPACPPTAPDAVAVTLPRIARDPSVWTALEASFATVTAATQAAPGSCGPAVPVVIPLGQRTRTHRRIAATVFTRARRHREAVLLECEAS